MTVNVSTNIKTEAQAQAAILDTVKNPPQSPVQAFQWLTKNVNFSAAFGKTIGGLIPGVGSIIGSLTDIFSAFSSAPSLGEIVLDGLKSLSNQIGELKTELTATIEKTAEIQTARTVDYVLQGVDEIQREVSAIQIMQSISDEASLQELAIQKNDIYTQYLADYSALQQSAYAEISDIINKCEQELNDLYAQIVARFGAIGFDFFKYLQGLTQKSDESSPTATRSAPAVSSPVNDNAENTGFNPLLLAPLLLLLFTKKEK